MLSRRSASRPMYLCVAVFFARYWSARHNCMIGLWFFSGQKDKIELYPRRDTHLRAAAPNKMLYLVILRKAPKFNDLWRVIICPCLGCHVWLTYIHAFVSYLADWRTHRHVHRQTHTHTHTGDHDSCCGSIYRRAGKREWYGRCSVSYFMTYFCLLPLNTVSGVK